MELDRYVLQLPHGSDPARGPGWTELLIRPGTSDVDVIKEVWIQDVYHVRGLTLGKDAHPSDREAWPWVIDIGACTGIFSALCAQMFPHVKVLAVEPEAANYQVLCDNAERFPGRIVPARAAVGGALGKATMIGGEGTGHTVASGGDLDDPTVVPLLTLDELMGPDDRCALLKIDCEGAEYEIIEAATQLDRVDRIAMEWHGNEMAPWRESWPIGRLVDKLLETHDVQVHGYPYRGGMLFAHRYPT